MSAVCAACHRRLRQLLAFVLNRCMAVAVALWRGQQALARIDDDAEAADLGQVASGLRAFMAGLRDDLADGEITPSEFHMREIAYDVAMSAVHRLRDRDSVENKLHEQIAEHLATGRAALREANEVLDLSEARTQYRQGGQRPVLRLIGERGEV